MLRTVLLLTLICGLVKSSGVGVAPLPLSGSIAPLTNGPVVTSASSQYFERTFNRLVVPPVVAPVAPPPLAAPVIPLSPAPTVFVEPTRTIPVVVNTQPQSSQPLQPDQPNIAIAVATAHAAAPVATILLPPYPFGFPPTFGFIPSEQPTNNADENTKEPTTQRTTEKEATTTSEPVTAPVDASNSDNNFVQALPSNQDVNYNLYGPPLQGPRLQFQPPSQSQTPNGQFQPQQPNPQFRPQQPNQQFQPQQPNLQFQPQQPNSQFQPQIPNPQFQSQQPNPQFQPQRPNPQFQPQQPNLKFQPQSPNSQYQPQQPNNQFQPQQPNQQFQPQQPNQQFLPQQPNQQFQPQQPNQQFQPQQPNQQFQPQQPNQQFQPQQPNQQFQPQPPNQQFQPQQPEFPPYPPHQQPQLQNQPQRPLPPKHQPWIKPKGRPQKLKTSVEVVPVPLAYITPPPIPRTHSYVKVMKHIYSYVPASSPKIILKHVKVHPVRLVRHKVVGVRLQNLRANDRDIEVTTINPFRKPNTKPPRV